MDVAPPRRRTRKPSGHPVGPVVKVAGGVGPVDVGDDVRQGGRGRSQDQELRRAVVVGGIVEVDRQAELELRITERAVRNASGAAPGGDQKTRY